ncbi:hypothetical protein V493_06844 [Pseudogymnoascus sp. VKM F-4281 (FW-2241)]|nr:hypothetical protein V493_06844 [Pseudogymnoascus sp. VKM F-4281 (FW-2241)]
MSRTPFGPVPPPIPYGRKLPEPPRRPSLADTAEIMSVNAVYYPNYRAYRGETPATLNYKCISHVYYAYAHVNADGFLSDELADGTMEVDGVNGCLGSFMVLKNKYPHLKVLLSIGGVDSSQSFRILSETAARRDNFARSANLLVREARLDGIDIDWQHPDDAQQGSNFLSLLATVRLYLPLEDYTVVVPLPTNSWALQHIDLPKIEEYVDLVNLTAYDFSGPWRPTAGHHAQLYRAQEGENSGSAAVEHILSTGFPAKKILLGIPVYGRSFIGATAPGDQYHSNGGDDGIFEYKALPRPGTQEVVDTERCAAVCVGGDGGFVTYDNPETVAMKGRYCKEQGLGVSLPLLLSPMLSLAFGRCMDRDGNLGIAIVAPHTLEASGGDVELGLGFWSGDGSGSYWERVNLPRLFPDRSTPPPPTAMPVTSVPCLKADPPVRHPQRCNAGLRRYGASPPATPLAPPRSPVPSLPPCTLDE